MIVHPLNALVYFLFYFGNINWSDVVITLGKPLSPIDMCEIPFSSMFSSPEVIAAVAEAAQYCADTSTSLMQDIDALISQYRIRYEGTVAASARAKEEDISLDSDVSLDERSANAAAVGDDSADTAQLAWGMTSARPSLTSQYQPPDSSPAPSSPTGFNRSHINVADCLRPGVNLTVGLSANDVEQLTELLRCGLNRLTKAMRQCDDVDPAQYDAVPLGMDSYVDIATLFISTSCGNTYDAALKYEQADHYPEEDADLQELKRSKFFCESEDPEAVMRHAELIMGSKVTPLILLSTHSINSIVELLTCS